MEPGDYRSSIGARAGYSSATRGHTSSSSSSTGRVLKIVTEMGSHTVSGLSGAMGAGVASGILDHREKERKEMMDLNDRLASYIEKVRFLEAQNRKLAADLDSLRGKWGKDTSSIKSMYEGELAEARKLIDETSKDKAALEGQIARLQQDLAEYRKRYEETNRLREGDKEKIEGLYTQLSDAEAEISLLRRRIQSLEEEVNRLRNENGRLLNELQKARNDLDQETLNRIDYQNQVQTLLEEIDFLNRVHDQELRELQALAARDTTHENREYFKNELALAIRDIRNEYDQVAAQNKVDMESWYKLKVQEIQSATARTTMESSYQREESKRLRQQLGDLRGKLADLESRNMLLEKQVHELSYQLEDDQRQYEQALNDRDAQIRKMRDECQSLMVELQMLLDTKQSLDAEIAIYRKMLEGEENRGGLKQLVDEMIRTHSIVSQEDTDFGESTVTSHSTRRVSYHKKRQQEGPDVTVEERYREDPNKEEREREKELERERQRERERERERDRGDRDRGSVKSDRDRDSDKGSVRGDRDRDSDRGSDRGSVRGDRDHESDRGSVRGDRDRDSERGSVKGDSDRGSVKGGEVRGRIISGVDDGEGAGSITGPDRQDSKRSVDSSASSKYGHIKPRKESTDSIGSASGSLRHQGGGDIKDVKGVIISPKGSPEEEKPFEESMRVVKGEMATRTSFQRSAKGNVSIAECQPEGRYIVIENTHRSKDETMDDWKLKRTLDGKREMVYTFPPKFVLRAGKTCKIWAKNKGGVHQPPDNIVSDEDSWGTGHSVHTVLYNKDGEEKATHIQRTSQQSSATS